MWQPQQPEKAEGPGKSRPHARRPSPLTHLYLPVRTYRKGYTEYLKVQTNRKINTTWILKEDITRKWYTSYVLKEEYSIHIE